MFQTKGILCTCCLWFWYRFLSEYIVMQKNIEWGKFTFIYCLAYMISTTPESIQYDQSLLNFLLQYKSSLLSPAVCKGSVTVSTHLSHACGPQVTVARSRYRPSMSKFMSNSTDNCLSVFGSILLSVNGPMHICYSGPTLRSWGFLCPSAAK